MQGQLSAYTREEPYIWRKLADFPDTDTCTDGDTSTDGDMDTGKFQQHN